MKNGIFTIGRNPVSMYLGSLKKLDKKAFIVVNETKLVQNGFIK